MLPINWPGIVRSCPPIQALYRTELGTRKAGGRGKVSATALSRRLCLGGEGVAAELRDSSEDLGEAKRV